MPGPVRFTPDELKALMDAGELSMGLMQKMHPDDVKVVQGFLNEGNPAGNFQKMTAAAAGAGMGFGALPAAGSRVLSAGKNLASGAGGMALYGGGAALLHKLGVPSDIITAIMVGQGIKGAFKGGGAAAEAEVGALTAEQQAIKAGLAKKGYPPELIDKILAKDTGAVAGVAAKGPNVIKEPTLSGQFGDVSKGVTNDFKGRVSLSDAGAGRVADPAGLDRALEAEMAKIQGWKSGASGMSKEEFPSGGWNGPPTSPEYGPLSDPAVNASRNLISKQLKRRSPK